MQQRLNERKSNITHRQNDTTRVESEDAGFMVSPLLHTLLVNETAAFS